MWLRYTYLLCKQVFCGMINVIICKGGHCEVAVVIVWLKSDIDPFLLTDFLCCCLEILRKQLALFVEIVACALCSERGSVSF